MTITIHFPDHQVPELDSRWTHLGERQIKVNDHIYILSDANVDNLPSHPEFKIFQKDYNPCDESVKIIYHSTISVSEIEVSIDVNPIHRSNYSKVKNHIKNLDWVQQSKFSKIKIISNFQLCLSTNVQDDTLYLVFMSSNSPAPSHNDNIVTHFSANARNLHRDYGGFFIEEDHVKYNNGIHHEYMMEPCGDISEVYEDVTLFNVFLNVPNVVYLPSCIMALYSRPVEVFEHFLGSENFLSYARTLSPEISIEESNSILSDLSFKSYILKKLVSQRRVMSEQVREKSRIVNSLIQVKRNIVEQEKIIANLEADIHNVMMNMSEKMTHVLQIPGVSSFTQDKLAFVLLTDFLYFEGGDKEIYELGQVEVRFSVLESCEITFENKTRMVKAYGPGRCNAPHVFSDGDACFGNLEPAIYEMLEKFDIVELVARIIEFLQTVNPDDVAGEYYYKWKKSSETEEEYAMRIPGNPLIR